jgi:hypothetical protein
VKRGRPRCNLFHGARTEPAAPVVPNTPPMRKAGNGALSGHYTVLQGMSNI